MIKIENLSKIYDNETIALRKLQLEIPLGKIYGVLGPNGAGKSTLFRILSTNLKPTQGEISYNGKSIINEHKWAKKNLRFCPQQDIVYDFLTVKENLELFATLQNIEHPQEKIDELINHLDMKTKIRTLARNLSGGQRKRLALMISLLSTPKILLLDEPTAGLDISSKEILYKYLKQLRKPDLTIILSTHDYFDAQNLCDRIAILNNGSLVQEDTPQALFKEQTMFELFKNLKEGIQ